MLEIVEKIRRNLSVDEEPPASELISTSIVPYIIKLLHPDFSSYDDLVIECSWTVANIASGKSEDVDYLVRLDVIPNIIQLLDRPNPGIQENANLGFG